MLGPIRDPLLHVAVNRDRNGVVVQVAGELDVATAPQLDEALRQASAGHPGRIVLDVERLTFIDPAGLAPLLSAHRRLPAGTLQMRNAQTPVLRVLRLLDLAPLFGLDGS